MNMKRLFFLLGLLVSVAASAAVAPDVSKSKLSVEQIISKNVTARGGLKAWHAVYTLTMSGRLEAGGTKNQALPFVMKMKRPHMSRLEITFQDQKAVQVFDGQQGWKVRPFLGRNDAEPYTPAEEKAAAGWQELDGPLVDYAQKGTTVNLLGMEAVEGHKAYKLHLTLKNGEERNVWIDAKTFLERKIDGDPRKMDGKLHNVAVYYRDYKTEKGLTTPRLFETVVENVKQSSHKMYIEHVAVNQTMENALFEKSGQALAKVSSPGAQPTSRRP
jgi:outer membrane lipoprotein-sorting protein